MPDAHSRECVQVRCWSQRCSGSPSVSQVGSLKEFAHLGTDQPHSCIMLQVQPVVAADIRAVHGCLLPAVNAAPVDAHTRHLVDAVAGTCCQCFIPTIGASLWAT